MRHVSCVMNVSVIPNMKDMRFISIILRYGLPSYIHTQAQAASWSLICLALSHTYQQAGGCCDCGDEDAWDANGFCHRHGQDGNDPLVHLPPSFITSARFMLNKSASFLLQAVEHIMESFDLDGCVDKAWAGPQAEYYLILHNDDVHTKRYVCR